MSREKSLRIRLQGEGRSCTTQLLDSASAKDFLALLPLYVTLTDYAANEKIANLPRKLATIGAPPSHRAAAGDLCYYAPWGNLALFHKDFGHAQGLVLLGRLDGPVDVLCQPGPWQVTIEPATDGD
ncbi:cyclophilin-like fold protein [Crenobacter sp. SG2305]|uniref:cyclophilin-like fold protein n=1 Tax=Crenobacter oryzisoli TaxID=3056844 RepID=UPI0025AA5E86|nr:cyclophilin-like fold protein [Crenobacter sp. SG2305]MDN0085227.1 cyclophilin-like fold protein [Crenobacter sp. SG2305]